MSEYTVQSGDTLSGIAKDLGIPMGALLEQNPGIANPNKIRPGDIVRLPTPVMGTTEVSFDPMTPANWKSPFAQFPTDSMAPTGSQMEATLKPPPQPLGITPPMASSMAADATAMAEAALDRAPAPIKLMASGAKAGLKNIAGIGDSLSQMYSPTQEVQTPDGPITLTNPGFDKLGPEGALLTLGGGSAASAAFGQGPKMVNAAGASHPMLAEPLPMGEPRHLPTQKKATGLLGLQQRTAKAGAMGEGMDPMWYDAVLNQVPAGELKNTPDTMVNTTSLGSNILRPDFSKGHIAKDPKENLARRMAKRNQSGEVLPPERFDQASTDRYARQAADERTNKWRAKDKAEYDAAVKKYGSEEAIPEWKASQIVVERPYGQEGKFETLADRRFHTKHPEVRDPSKMDDVITSDIRKALADKGNIDRVTYGKKGETKPIRKLMDIHQELESGTMTKAEAKKSLEERLLEISKMLDQPDTF